MEYKKLVQANRRRNSRIAKRWPMFAEEFSESVGQTELRFIEIGQGWIETANRLRDHNDRCANLSVLLRDAVMTRAMGGIAMYQWNKRVECGLDATFGIGSYEYTHWRSWAIRLKIFDVEFWQVENGQWREEACRRAGAVCVEGGVLWKK